MTTYSSGIFITLFVASAAFAGDEIPTKDKAHTAVEAHLVRTSAQRIFLDPATGQARSPTREERQQLQQQNATVVEANKTAEETKKVRFPDGAVGVYLKKPKSLLQAEITKDGRVKTACKDHPQKVHP